MVDGKIDLVKTQCVGFELRVSDSFLNDCISVDCIVGATVAASVSGIAISEMKPAAPKEKKKIKLPDYIPQL